jgi:hypothetical protein
MNDRDRQFAGAVHIVQQSATIKWLDACAASFETAVVTSSAASLWLRIGRPKTASIVVFAVAGCVTHWLLLQIVPARLAPAAPLGYWMVVAFAAFAVAAAGFITMPNNATATADSSAGTAKTRKS